jgi:hypothetical protein
LRAHQQCVVTSQGEDKNKNGKRNPEIVRETQIIGKKERNLSKKKAKLEKIQVTENRWKISHIGTSQEAGLQDLNLVKIAEPRRMGLLPGEAI